MSEKLKAVEKMIEKVQKKKDLSRAAAIDYMLIVATGRLAALWRYDDTLPEGKRTKGILTTAGRKKRAPKTPKIAPPISADQSAPEPTPKRKHPKKRSAKPKAEKSESTQLEIAAAE